MKDQNNGITRRGLLTKGALVGVGATAITAANFAAPKSAQAKGHDSDDDMMVPIPAQAPSTEGMAETSHAKLWYTDTGGDGPVIVALHPATGSGAIWEYQQPAFVAAGYRLITYSRRGYFKSEAGPEEAPGSAADDLIDLVNYLKIDKFHVLAAAAGGIYAMDFALSYADRIISMVQTGTFVGPRDPEYRKRIGSIRPKIFGDLPAEFREVGPSYRFKNEEGLEIWKANEAKAQHTRVRPKAKNEITIEKLKSMPVPTLLLAGGADLWSPPSIMRFFIPILPNNEFEMISEVGHSAFWEKPLIFNDIVLDFFNRHTG